MNDNELIDRTLAGDSSAFGILVDKYQDRVYNLALPIVGNVDDAMDAAQETFLQALAHLGSFRKSSRFYTWLYRIAYNSAVGLLRRRRRTVSVDTVIEEYGETFEANVEAPDARASLSDDARLLKKALEKLPIEYRAPLILREIEGENYERIAEILEIPVGTVRSRLHRARASLRDALERLGVQP